MSKLFLASAFLVLGATSALAKGRCVEEIETVTWGKANTPGAVLVSNYGFAVKGGCLKAAAVSSPVAQVKAPIEKAIEPVVSPARTVEFTLNSWALSKDAREEIERLAEEVKSAPAKSIKVSGFADKTGPEALNQRLSEKRAAEVKKVLTQKGVSAKSLKVEAFGSKPEDASRRVDVEVE